MSRCYIINIGHYTKRAISSPQKILVLLNCILLFVCMILLCLYLNSNCDPCVCPGCPKVLCECSFECESPPIHVTNVTNTIVEYSSQFQEIVSGVCIEKPYQLGGWDCDKRALEIVKRLQHSGLPCHTQVGRYNNDDFYFDHAWVVCGKGGEGLIIEPNTCAIVEGYNYWRYEKDRKV